MGSGVSNLIKLCGLRNNKKSRQINNANEDDAEENQIENVDEGGLIEKNRDNYFTKDDFEILLKKFPNYRDWMSQSLAASTKKGPKQKRIKWKEGEVIGHGSFGRVVMGLNLQTGSIMAVKQVQIGASNTQAQQDRIKALEIEIEFLSQLSHKNIVRYFRSSRNKTTFNIFLEYISGGTIASLIEKYGPFNETLAKVYTKQILEGLEYLHVRNTIHRDIKGANVLVDNNGICKLADFGTAKRISNIVDNETKYMPSIKGTVNWMAPEVIRQTNLGRQSDIWSVGCTVLEMLTGKAPWSQIMKPNANQVSVLYQIASAKSHPPISTGLSTEAIDFLKLCFKINPAERPNVIKLLNHKFITKGEVIEKSIPLPDLDKTKSQTAITPKHKKSDSISSKTNEKQENSKRRISYSKYCKDGPSISEGQDQKEAKDQTNNKAFSDSKKERKNITIQNEESSNEISKKAKYKLRSLVEVQNNSNFDISSRMEIEEKLILKNVARNFSTPGSNNVSYQEKKNLNESHNRTKSSQLISIVQEDYHNSNKLIFSPTSMVSVKPDLLEVVNGNQETSESKPKNIFSSLSQRNIRMRPLGKQDFVETSKQVANSREENVNIKKSDPINQHDIDSNFKPKKGQLDEHKISNKDNKEGQIIIANKIYIKESSKKEEKELGNKRKDELIGRLSKISENESQNLENFPKEDRLSTSKDSDIEASLNCLHQNKISTVSTKTLHIPDGMNLNEFNRIINGTESISYSKKGLSFKLYPSKEVMSTINEGIGDNLIGQVGTQAPFNGIQLTESLVMRKPDQNQSEESQKAHISHRDENKKYPQQGSSEENLKIFKPKKGNL